VRGDRSRLGQCGSAAHGVPDDVSRSEVKPAMLNIMSPAFLDGFTPDQQFFPDQRCAVW
jgi:hypothetical protein